MKNSIKTRSTAESYSASEAARLLGVSIPTLKRMAADRQVESFRTPGGHLRVVAESIEALRERRRQPRPVRDPSPVLQNRRERLEELTLEAQELRAKRELEKLRREEAEEVERRDAEAEEREREAAERTEALELERALLEHQQTQEQERREAEQQLAEFRCRWLSSAAEVLSAKELRWLSAAQRKEILEGLEAEIERRRPQEEPRMLAIVSHSLVALVQPFITARETNKRRQDAAERALWHLSAFATDSEKAQASEAVRKALAALPDEAKDIELRATSEEAIRPVQKAVEKRLLGERVITWAVWQLPLGSDDCDKARFRRKCAEIFAELPEDASEVEAKEAMEPTIREAREKIEKRQAEKERQARQANLIQQGVAEVLRYMLKLKREGEISDEDYWDSDFTADLSEAVRRGLQRDLSGDETPNQLRKLAREIIDTELA